MPADITRESRLTLPRVSCPASAPGTMSAGPWAIDFGDGVTATVTLDLADRSAYPSKRYDWALDTGAGEPTRGHCFSMTSTYLQLWCRASRARPIPGLGVTVFEIYPLVQQVMRDDAVKTAKVIRQLLRQRTGFAWSVRKHRGSEAVIISARPARAKNGAMTLHDAALLAGVLGLDHVNTKGFRVDGETRADVVRKIAGPAAPHITEIAL